MNNRWREIRRTSPSGKMLFVCICCGRVSPCPDKKCETIGDPTETWECSLWPYDRASNALVRENMVRIEQKHRAEDREAGKSIVYDMAADATDQIRSAGERDGGK